MSNTHHTVFYIGVTSDLIGRTWQHKNGEGGVFTSKYNCNKLLYYEDYSHIKTAIEREKQLKRWKRTWKMELIQKENGELNDLAENWYD